jgi:biopolymer transport protein ExbD
MDAGLPGRKARSAINVTPLIDVVLVLLIVFIVMLPRLTRTLAVAVPRPLATTTPAPSANEPPVPLSVRRSAGGAWECLLRGEPVRLPELADRLLPVVLRQPPERRRVTLRIDGEAPYQAAVDVLDQVRLASDRVRQASRANGGPEGDEIKVAIASTP